MESRVSVVDPKWSRYLVSGVLALLIFLLAGLLLVTSPAAVAGDSNAGSDSNAGGGSNANSVSSLVMDARPALAPSEPQTLTLEADPAIIPPNGVAFSDLTATVQDSPGGPAAEGTVVVFSTTLGTFPGGLTITPEPTGTMTVEAESGEVVTTGTWLTYTQVEASGGEVIYSDGTNAQASYTFTGTAVAVIFQKQYNAGIARAFLDGTLFREIDTFWDDGSGAGKLFQQEELIAEDLPYAPHTVEVVVSGDQHPDSLGSYLVIDAFRIYGHDQNGAYLTSGGEATARLKSATTPGAALATACAGPACDSTTVHFVWPEAQSLSLSADRSPILANGLSTSTLTAEVLSPLHEPVADGTVVVFSTTLGTFPGGLTLTPEPTGVMTIEAESGDVTQTGTWIEWAEAQASDGKLLYSDSAGDRLTLPFTGTAVSVIFQKQDNAGIARVFVDGVLHRRIDTYSDTTLYKQEELIIEGLPYAPHVLEVRVTGNQNVASSGAFLLVDAIRIYGHDQNGAYLTSGGSAAIPLTSAVTPGTAQAAACAYPACDSTPVEMVSASPVTLDLTANPTSIQADGISTSLLTAHVLQGMGHPVLDGTVVVFSTTLGTLPSGVTLTPEPTGVMTIEAESGDVTRTGTWVEYLDPQASDGKGVYSNGVGDKVTYAFTGTAVSVLFQRQSNAGIGRVYVDGALYREIDTYSAATLYQQEETIAEGLPYAPHFVEVVVTGMQNPASSDSYLVVDAILVYGHDRNGAYLTSSGIATTTLTSAASSGTAQVTACADSVCDSASVDFHFFSYLPLVLKDADGPPVFYCEELIENGGFEDSTDWAIGNTSRPARYTIERAHSGAQSMLLGIKPGEADVRSFSSVQQTITLPANLSGATLSFWYYPMSDLDSDDRQDCLLLDGNGDLLDFVMRHNVDTQDWTEVIYSLDDYAGQTLRVYFNAFNDGDGSGVTSFYLDDVSVQACTTEPPSPPIQPCYPQELTTIGVGGTPHGVAVNSDAQHFYVANHDDDTLSVISGTTYSVVATVAAGDGPKQVAYNATTGKIYVTNRNSNAVTVLRGSDHGLEATESVGLLPNGVAVNENTNRVYVANWESGTVSILNGATDTVSQTVPVGAEPSMVAVNPTTNKAYVTLHGEGKVAVIDGAGTATQVDLFSSAPYGIAVDTVRNLVYVATIDSYRIVVIDGSTDTFAGWAEIRRLPGTEPVPLRMIAVNPLIGSSGHIFVTTAEEDTGWNRFLLLPKGWPEYFARAHALALNEPREGIAFDASTQQVWATSRSDDVVSVYLDGEPTCPNNFAATRGYQLKVCVAGRNSTCQEELTR